MNKGAADGAEGSQAKRRRLAAEKKAQAQEP
jgi:hypothetical protein